jgi:hypothetical protein
MNEFGKLPPRWHLQRLLFFIVIGIGSLIAAFGLFILPGEAHFQLDQVLSPEELRDEKIRDRTLEILKKASNGGRKGLVLAVPGLTLIAVGLIGIFAATPSKDAKQD